MSIFINGQITNLNLQQAIQSLPSSGGVIDIVNPNINATTYTIPSRTLLPSNFMLRGTGIGQVIIQAGVFTSTIGDNPIYGEQGDCMFYNTSAGTNHTAYTTIDSNITFENITLDGNGPNQLRKVFGIALQYVKGVYFKNVYCQNFGQLNLSPDVVNTEAAGNRESISLLLRNCDTIDISNCPQLNTDGIGTILCKHGRVQVGSGTGGTSEIIYASDCMEMEYVDTTGYSNESGVFYLGHDHASFGGTGNKNIKVDGLIGDTTNHTATYSSWTSPGINVNTADKITITNCQIFNSWGYGMALTAVTNSNIENNLVYNNSKGATQQLSGIFLSNSQNNSIRDNQCFDDQNSHTQYIGIVEDDTCDYNSFSGNKLRNNVSSDFFCNNNKALHSERYDNEGMEGRYHRRFRYLYNATGGQITSGYAVIYGADANGEYFNTTSTGGDPKILGLTGETINNATFGRIQTEGRFYQANVTGTISLGDLLTVNATGNYLKAASAGDIAIAIALAANAAGTALKDVFLINPRKI